MFYKIGKIMEFVVSEGFTHCLLESSAHKLCKQIGARSGPTKRWARSGSNLFDSQMVFLKELFEKS